MRIATTSSAATPTPPRDLMAGEPGSPVATSADPRFAQFKVIRRNGAVVGFEPAKITIAMTKAFLAVNGGQGASSARVRDEVARLTDAVVAALLKRKPDGGAIHIEEIQDQVELALMRGGEHEVARAYVLYREKRSQERAQEKQQKAPAAEDTTLHVIDNGVRKPLDFARLTDLVNASCDGLPDAEPNRILKATLKDLYDGVPMEEVRKCVVLAARTLIEKDPAYSYVTARLLLDALRFEALGEEATQADMDTKYAEYFPRFIKHGIKVGLLNEALAQFDLTKLGKALQPRRDLQFGYLGQQSTSFEQIAAFYTGGIFLGVGDETERVKSTAVSADFFSLFGTAPLRGRAIEASDAPDEAPWVVVISYALWQRRFGGAADVVNRQITFNGHVATIVGVMPAEFNYPQDTELWYAFMLDPAREERINRYVQVLARLKPGVTIAQAQSELDTINQRLAQNYVESNNGWGVRLYDFSEHLVGELRTSLIMLFGAVGFVLLIACANVANLLLARAAYRQKEIALRTALGASRLRIVRQLLTESVLLWVVSGAVGLGLSVWLIRLLIAISPPNTPRFDEIRINWQVFLFTFSVTILAGLLFGLVPALQTSRFNLNDTLKESGRSGGPGGTRNRVGGLLIVSEVALSFVLLAGAGLLIKSFAMLRDIDPGFKPDNVLTVRVNLPPDSYKQGEERVQIFRQLVDQVKRVPGVENAGAVLSLPLKGDTFNLGRNVILEEKPAISENEKNAFYLSVTSEYFNTLQIPLKQGRLFSDRDDEHSAKVVIVNETMARQLWPGESPIGRRFTIAHTENFLREVVGVVGDTKMDLDKPADPQMYVPYAQDQNWGWLSFVVRTKGDPAAVGASVREAVRSVDKRVATYNLKTMNEVVSTAGAAWRVPMMLLTAFAGVAMLLAMLGIYGITSYYVTQRTHEIGVRMALGAQIVDVLKLVLRRAMLLAVIGVGIGVVGAFAVTRYLTSLLFGVKPFDAITFAAVALGLVVVALLAAVLPARRATKVDPLVALRYE